MSLDKIKTTKEKLAALRAEQAKGHWLDRVIAEQKKVYSDREWDYVQDLFASASEVTEIRERRWGL